MAFHTQQTELTFFTVWEPCKYAAIFSIRVSKTLWVFLQTSVSTSLVAYAARAYDEECWMNSSILYRKVCYLSSGYGYLSEQQRRRMSVSLSSYGSCKRFDFDTARLSALRDVPTWTMEQQQAQFWKKVVHTDACISAWLRNQHWRQLIR